MNSKVWKFGILAALVILSNCVNDPPSTLHPVLSLKVERVNDTSWVNITSTAAEDYSLYRIVDDTCTLQVSYHAIIGGIPEVVDTSFAIANDSAAFEAGKFNGIWVAPDSLYLLKGTFPFNTMDIYGCVTDETEHEACGSLILSGNTSLPE